MKSPIRLWTKLFVLVFACGCNNAPAPPLVGSIGVLNGYEIECELVAPIHIHTDATRSVVTTGKTTVAIVEGKLSVGGKAHGTVSPNDKIRVVGDKVMVNGQDRKPDA